MKKKAADFKGITQIDLVNALSENKTTIWKHIV